MKIIFASHLGFCFGVERAYQLIKKETPKAKKPVQLIGSLVHNSHVTKETKALGVIDHVLPEEVREGTVIVPSHGIDTPALEKLKRRPKTNLIDSTCPKVSQVIKEAEKLAQQQYTILILGDNEHSEIRAINKSINNQGIIFQEVGDLPLKKLKNKKHLCLISQTTQETKKFLRLAEQLKNILPQLEIRNTICPATHLRQKAALRLVPQTDIIVVIGSPESANSKRLYEILKRVQKRTYFIDEPREIKSEWFKKKDVVGITAGASTPESIIQKVARKIAKL